jgi:hypothetical protein
MPRGHAVTPLIHERLTPVSDCVAGTLATKGSAGAYVGSRRLKSVSMSNIVVERGRDGAPHVVMFDWAKGSGEDTEA